MRKIWVLGIVILLGLFLAGMDSRWSADGSRLARQGIEEPSLTSPEHSPLSPGRQRGEAHKLPGTITINTVSPRAIYTNTSQITVSYFLHLALPIVGSSRVAVKIGLFLDNQLKQTQEINNFPNGETLRLFISFPAPNQARDYVLTLKAVRADVSPESASLSQTYAIGGSQTIRVNEALPDLIIESFEVGDPDMRTEGSIRWVYFPCRIRVKNIGAANAGVFGVIVRETSDGRKLRGLCGTQSPLSPGQSILLSCEMGDTVGGGAVQDIYRLQAKADDYTGEFLSPERAVKELNEDNNLSPIVEKRSLYVRITVPATGSFQAYRGGQIDVLGSFGTSFEGKRVAIFRGGVREAYADVVNSSYYGSTISKLTIKIPNQDSIARGVVHKLLIVDNRDFGLSNAIDLYICNPLRLTQVKILESQYSGALINERHSTMVLEKDERCRRISWALARNYPVLDTEVKTLDAPFIFIPNLRFASNEYRTNVTVVVRDACLVGFSDDSEGTSRIQIPIYNLFKKQIGVPGITLFLPCFKVHIDQAGSYFQVPEFCPDRGGTFFNFSTPAVKIVQDNAPDLKVWLRDINCTVRTENILTISGGVARFWLPFETGGADEVGLSFWSGAELPDINLHKLEINVALRFSTNWQLDPNKFVTVGGVKVDLEADINAIPDSVVEAFTGEIEPMIEQQLQREISRALNSPDIKKQIFDSFINNISTIVGRPNPTILAVQGAGDQIEILYYIVQ